MQGAGRCLRSSSPRRVAGGDGAGHLVRRHQGRREARGAAPFIADSPCDLRRVGGGTMRHQELDKGRRQAPMVLGEDPVERDLMHLLEPHHDGEVRLVAAFLPMVPPLRRCAEIARQGRLVEPQPQPRQLQPVAKAHQSGRERYGARAHVWAFLTGRRLIEKLSVAGHNQVLLDGMAAPGRTSVATTDRPSSAAAGGSDGADEDWRGQS